MWSMVPTRETCIQNSTIQTRSLNKRNNDRINKNKLVHKTKHKQTWKNKKKERENKPWTHYNKLKL